MPVQNASADTRAQTSDMILDAAEAVFSDRGFHGATTRAIAEIAGANLALIHYYFGTKEALYDAVFSRRSEEINSARRTLLMAAMAGANPQIEDLLEAFFRPSVSAGRQPNRAGHNYARMVAIGAAGTDERSRELTSRHYDGIAREFIAAFEQVLPTLGHGMAARSYLYATSISISLMANTGRVALLSDGACTEDDLEAVIAQAVRFVTAGIHSFVAAEAEFPDALRRKA